MSFHPGIFYGDDNQAMRHALERLWRIDRDQCTYWMKYYCTTTHISLQVDEHIAWLNDVADPEFSLFFLNTLVDQRDDSHCRKSAIQIAGPLTESDRKIIAFLEGMSIDEDDEVRKEAVRVLEQLKSADELN
jgi:hypothetical protein